MVSIINQLGSILLGHSGIMYWVDGTLIEVELLVEWLLSIFISYYFLKCSTALTKEKLFKVY